MKRILTLVGLLLSLTLLLTACGSSAAETSAEVATDPAAIDTAALPQTIDAATTAALQQRDDVILLDVREQWEYDEGHIPGVVHIPMNSIPATMSELPTDKTVIVTCRSGNRSSQVTTFLRDNGFTNVHNMAGGILAWQAGGLPVERGE
jgi:phage shock protein E